MKILKELGKAFFVGLLVFLVLGLIRYFMGFEMRSGNALLNVFIANQIYSVLIYMGNYIWIMYLIKKYKGQIFSLKRLLIAGSLTVVISFICIFIAEMVVAITLFQYTFKEALDGVTKEDFYSSMIISIVVTAIFFIFYYYKYRQESKVKEQKIIAGAASAQFDALKNQLDPHFLFNSLNVLTSLIEENPTAATKFTTSLSKVYRYVLEQKSKQLVTLEEELKFAKLYMSLIKMRFEDSIVFTMPEVLNNPEAKVVPLSLQLLLENAVKHNMVTPSKKLHITISEENNTLVVKNNVQPKKVMKESTGVGLQNIHKRYYLLTDRRVSIHNNDNEFAVGLPLLTKQASLKPKTQNSYISAKKYDRAKEYVEALKGFYIHFAIYCIMVPAFIYLNFISTPFPWAMFPIVGWGAGVAGHGMEVFNYNPFLGRNWEEKKIRQLMEKDDT